MRRIPFLAALVVGLCSQNIAEAMGFKDGLPFRPRVPVTWAATNLISQTLPVYRVVTNRLSQSAVSNAMTLGSFKSLDLLKSKEKGIMEFRDKPRDDEWTRFLQISENQGWVKYYDKSASHLPPHGVPSFEEADILALRYLILLGGDTNQLSAKPWPHNESTFETRNPSDGQLMAKGVSRRWVCLFRQIGGIPITGNSLSVDFGCDAKPIMLEMNWPPLETVRQFRIPRGEDIVAIVKGGKAWIQMSPPPPEDITNAISYKIKKFVPLYAQSTNGESVMEPYGALLVEADMGGRIVSFVINCQLASEK